MQSKVIKQTTRSIYGKQGPRVEHSGGERSLLQRGNTESKRRWTPLVAEGWTDVRRNAKFATKYAEGRDEIETC